jgi:hypothetical protein
MTIERTKNEVIFRLPSSINLDDLQSIADMLEFKEIAKKSRATQKEVNTLVKTIKAGRWIKTKSAL